MRSKWRIFFCSVAVAVSILCCSRKNSAILPPPTNVPRDTTPIAPPAEVPGYNLRPVHMDVTDNIGGFYEALPPQYDSTQTMYPLLVFLHGGAEVGDGQLQLPLVLLHAVPKMIAEKTFPLSFAVNGQTFSFVVLTPQFKKWPAPSDIHALILHASDHYRIDTNRVYLTGLSMGGGATWEYAARYGTTLAAMAPICGASWADSAIAKKIALTNTPIWAFHNNDDSVVSVRSTTRYVNFINSFAPAPPAKMTLWPIGGHDAWTKATDTTYKEENKNMYEWMLSFVRD